MHRRSHGVVAWVVIGPVDAVVTFVKGAAPPTDAPGKSG